MSQWEADPDLVQRRLATLVRLMRNEVSRCGKSANKTVRLTPDGLTLNEIEQWANQCSNLLNAPMCKSTKPIETMTDEELLS